MAMKQRESKDAMPPKAVNTMRSVDKALGLLHHFSLSNPEFGLSELARTAGLDKATTLRCLNALERHGMVEQDGHSKKYRLGLGLLHLARIREVSFPFAALIQPEIENLCLQTRETAHVSTLSGVDLVTIAIAEPKRSVRVTLDPAEVLAVHASASGQVLLAAGSKVGLDDLPRPLKAFTGRTMTDPQALQDRLDRVAKAGFSICEQTFEEDVTGIAAPILDRRGQAIAAVAVASLASRQTPDTIRFTLARVQETAARISHMLGISPQIPTHEAAE